ncbi:MAG TPA: tetratricopeptide repeat protein [Candidatus Eremiobacteraeota bacterium]|nr:MAG: tetratricopeptide repeat protein [bacterium ADurb.Bin363]HPZ07411.1 tetratricopeptide repeat protein [Candidatus Eremiobacteraeota bacterium]
MNLPPLIIFEIFLFLGFISGKEIMLADNYIKTKLHLAVKLKEVGHYEGAEEALREGLSKEPYNTLLLTSLADLYSRQDRLEEAFSLAEEVLSREFNNQRALIVKGDVSLKRRKYSEGVDYFKNALQLGGNPYIYKRLIQSLMGKGNFSEAMKYCEEITSQRPDDTVFMKLLARCYKNLKLYKEAEGLYKKLIEKYPKDGFLYKEYIEVKTIDKSPEEIVKELDAILKVPSNSENVHMRLFQAGTLKKLGRFNEALEHYKIALNRSPGDIYTLKQAGFCYIKMGFFKEAISTLKEAFLNDPSDYYVKTSLTSAYKQTGDLEEFVKLIEEAIKKHPGEKKLWGFKKKILKQI